jgi:uridine kinase
VPLLRRRADFAGTDRFHLYDATASDRAVVEDVFAYSNGPAGRPNLVVVHNRFAEVEVRIDHSVAAATRDASGHRRKTTTRLARALELAGADATPIRFRDQRSGRELRVTVGELRDRGLALHLGPYEAVVFDVDVAPAEPTRPMGLAPELDPVVTYEAIAAEIRSRTARLGRVRLVAVDGPGGAGKTSVARRLAAALGGAPIVETDDFASWERPHDWWPRLEREVLEPLAAGEAATYRAYDWEKRRLGRRKRVDVADVVVLEGVSSGRRAIVDRLSFLVWIDAPPAERLARGIRRDGEARRADWERWMAEEAAFYADDPVRQRADLVVDGDPSIEHDPDREVIGTTPT